MRGSVDFFSLLAFLEMLRGAGEAPPGPMPPGPLPSPLNLPPPPVPVAPPAPPGTLPPMPPIPVPAVVPSTLPPFPGPGWVYDVPVSAAVVDRAKYWNPILWNYATKTIAKPFVQEQFGGRWLTFSAAWHPGDQGAQTYMSTEAWRLASAPPMPAPLPTPPIPVPVIPTPAVVPPPAPAPMPVPVPPHVMPAPAPMPVPVPVPVQPAVLVVPGPVGPEPAPGAWKTNATYIARYQNALSYLARARNQPSWDPKGVDGKFGPNTQAAVMAFQRAKALTVDGQCGNQTSAALDQELGYGMGPPAPAPLPIPPAPVAPMPMPAAGPPPPVEPYPGPGAWQSNSAYIIRYQRALTYLGFDTQGIDGKYGPHTAAAVKAFQAANALTQDGQAGPATAAAIDAVLGQHAAAA